MMERMVSVWSYLLGNSIINVRTTQSQVNFNTVVLQFVGPTLSGTSQFVGPGFGSTLVLAGISILRKIIKYVVHTY